MARYPVLMVVHAHPDDEAIGTGGILRKYADRGVRTVLVLATKGETGEIDGRVPSRREKAALVDLRLDELRCSCQILGVEKTYFLGYRDSGMAGKPENTAPGAFAAADMEEATRRLVGIIRAERPHVITTYNENGTYGHPDHIQVNRVTVRGFQDAGRVDRFKEIATEPWQPLKLYYQAIPLSRIRKMGEIMRSRAEELRVDPESMGTEEEKITTWVDIRDVIKHKFAAIQCHKSQVGENSFFNRFDEKEREALFGSECFVWVAGCERPQGRERDLFDSFSNQSGDKEILG